MINWKTPQVIFLQTRSDEILDTFLELNFRFFAF